MSIKVANGSIVQHMGTKGGQLQHQCLCQKFECSRPIVSIKVAKGSLVQHLGTIPARLGLAWLGSGRVGSANKLL